MHELGLTRATREGVDGILLTVAIRRQRWDWGKGGAFRLNPHLKQSDLRPACAERGTSS